MTRMVSAAIFMALLAAPAAAPASNASSASSSGALTCREIGDTGRICCNDCGDGSASAGEPVDVPAPPAVLLFAAGAMALAARRRASSR